ncbi:hypothetical protein [Streptomyces sp. NPDC048636]|uniref:hypothetical protein n=1 Tax=Streptomyces sp. NPDC048636 TaxID=3155762 RepID=UPI00343D7A50
MAFLTAVSEFYDLGRAAAERALLDQAIPPGSADRFRSLISNIEKALLLVEMEGPGKAAEAAARVVRCIALWQTALLARELRTSRGLPPRTDIPTSEEVESDVNAAVGAFKRAVREVLDAPDASAGRA